MIDFYRSSLIKRGLLGLDSIQGLLELSTWYVGDDGGYITLSKKTSGHSGRNFETLKQLEKEGYVTLKFLDENNEGVKLESVTLTISGHKLLAELRDKSAKGRLKKRLGDLVWVILTSVLTTLVVLWIKQVK